MTTEVNPHLVTGSVWQRAKKKSLSTVLAVSNEGLQDSILTNYPQQVVFLTNNGKILTQDIDSFLASRTYVGTDDFIVSQVASIVAGPEEEVDTESIDSIKLDEQDSDFEKFISGDAGIESSTDNSDESIPVFEPPVFGGLALNENFISYMEMPHHTGDTMCILKFALGSKLSLQDLNQTFNFSGKEDSALTHFIIDSEEERTEVEVNGFLSVLLETDSSGAAYGNVYLTVDGNARWSTGEQEEAGLQDAGHIQGEPYVIPQLSAAVTLTPVNAHLTDVSQTTPVSQ